MHYASAMPNEIGVQFLDEKEPMPSKLYSIFESLLFSFPCSSELL